MVENAATVGSYLRNGLEELQEQYPIVGDVRGLGLMLSMELVADRASRARFPREANVVELLNEGFRKRGLLMRAHGQVLINLSPPLCITRNDADEILSGIGKTLGEVSRELGVGVY